MSYDMLVQELLNWFRMLGRIAVGLDRVRNANVSTMFLQALQVVCLLWFAVWKHCAQLLALKQVKASVLADRGDF
jgi:hypothetical protein